MKILYVEDEIAHVELAQRTLEDNLKDEFVLLHSESIKGALDILMGEPDIDVVLSDLRLPDGSGFSWKHQHRDSYTVKATDYRVLREIKSKKG